MRGKEFNMRFYVQGKIHQGLVLFHPLLQPSASTFRGSRMVPPTCKERLTANVGGLQVKWPNNKRKSLEWANSSHLLLSPSFEIFNIAAAAGGQLWCSLAPGKSFKQRHCSVAADSRSYLPPKSCCLAYQDGSDRFQWHAAALQPCSVLRQVIYLVCAPLFPSVEQRNWILPYRGMLWSHRVLRLTGADLIKGECMQPFRQPGIRCVSQGSAFIGRFVNVPRGHSK